MIKAPRWIYFILIIGSALLAWQQFSRTNTINFVSDVKPILNRKCMACHGGVKQSGGFSLLTREEALRPTESGKTAIVPGDAAASELIRRLSCSDVEERMPYREEPLEAKEIEILSRWIDEGAEWGTHWAYQNLRPIELPGNSSLWGSLWGGNTDHWGHNEIDRFVQARLKQEKLSPSPEADRVTLLRRLCLDLTGLPPTDAQLNQFLQDSSAGAYERMADSLLASPHFGERWAAVWLDLARYADSKGYERDAMRSIWRYRDWLIRSLNADMPYDQFLTEQLAGDLLPNPTDAQLTATAFHRNTPTNDEGGTDNEEFRVAAVLDRVNTTWEGLMGTSFSCVQCHSHPYDAFFHEEYYRFSAFFNNTRDYDTQADFPLIRWYAGEDSLRYLRLDSWLKQYANPFEAEKVRNFVKTGQPAYYSIECDSLRNCTFLDTKFLGFSQPSAARLPQVNLDGKNRLVARWVNLTKEAGGTVTLRLDRPDGPVLTKIAVPKSAKEAYWELFYVDFQAVAGTHDLWLSYSNPRLAKKPEAFGCQLDWMGFLSPFPGKGQVGFENAEKDFFQLLTANCETTPIMWENPGDMQRKTWVFERGNWLVHGSEVQAATPRYMPPFPSDQARNRLGLARWMCAPEHPLTARVLVNRLWEQMFGLGIVETVEDFGSQGFAPSHPELLDWMAWTFSHEDKWSLKKTLRRMVLSATYRQSSAVGPELQARDPQNQWLARGPRVRLSAEQIRDQALLVSGLLSSKMYGKPVMPYQPDGIWGTPWNDEAWNVSKGEDQYRRALYTYWKRSSPYPSMMTFDGAGRQLCTARRIRTNTPLQALVTLNDPVYVECAKHFALKMRQQGGNELAAQIRAGYQAATGRQISPQKLQVLQQLYSDALRDFQKKPQSVTDFLHDLACEQHSAELAALALVGNALLNLDEVIVKG